MGRVVVKREVEEGAGDHGRGVEEKKQDACETRLLCGRLILGQGERESEWEKERKE